MEADNGDVTLVVAFDLVRYRADGSLTLNSASLNSTSTYATNDRLTKTRLEHINGMVPRSSYTHSPGGSSVWGRVNRVPHLVKTIAQDYSAKGQEAFRILPFPMHPRSNQARAELFDAPLDHPAPNRETVFTRFQVLHASLIGFKIAGFFVDESWRVLEICWCSFERA